MKRFSRTSIDVTSGQTAANRYLKALAGKLVNDRHTLQLSSILGTVKDKIVTPYMVRELCPVYPLCRGAQKLTFTTLSNHLKPLTAANQPDSFTTNGQFFTPQKFVDLAVAPVRILMR